MKGFWKDPYCPNALSGFTTGFLLMLGIISSEGIVEQTVLITAGAMLLLVSIWAEHKTRRKDPTPPAP
ncbi:MAG: hypothetical protein Q7S83_03125 [bacterium]|nr:hypothetical protein [bacterium]